MNAMISVKKTIFIVCVLVVFAYFRHAFLSLFMDTEVGGRKYIGLFVDGNETNGFSYLSFSYPYMQLADEDAASWSECNHLNESLVVYLRNYVDKWKPQKSYTYITETDSHWYKAYIGSGDMVIYVHGFSDLGGAPPSEGEKKICNTSMTSIPN